MSKKLIKFTLMLIAGIFGLMCIQVSWAADPASAGLQAWSFPEKSLLLSQSSSVSILVQLFGPLVQLIVDPSGIPLNIKGYLFADVLAYWNFFISSSAAAFISYHLILGFVKSSENGRFLGREDEKVGTIMRFCMGGFLVAPVIKGKFCIMQILFMGWILVGVNVANKVWRYATYDISMGVTPTIPASISETINQLIGQMYLYRTVDLYLSSGVMPRPVTSTGAYLVDLEDQPGFESVANAVLNKHSYHMWAMQGAKSGAYSDSDANVKYELGAPFFQNLNQGVIDKIFGQDEALYKDDNGNMTRSMGNLPSRRFNSWCKDNYNFIHKKSKDLPEYLKKYASRLSCAPDASEILDYQVGSWVIASNGIVWKGGIRNTTGVDNIVGPSNRRSWGLNPNALPIAGFERAVLMDNGSADQTQSTVSYNVIDGSMSTATGSAHPAGLNAREAALIAPLGFTTQATPTDTNFPILAGSGPMYVKSFNTAGFTPSPETSKKCPCVDGDQGGKPGEGHCWNFGGGGDDKGKKWQHHTGGLNFPAGLSGQKNVLHIFNGYSCTNGDTCVLANVGGYKYGCYDLTQNFQGWPRL